MDNEYGNTSTKFASRSPILASIKSSQLQGDSSKEDTCSNKFSCNELPSLNDRVITIRYVIFHSTIYKITIYKYCEISAHKCTIF